ncbi:MAG: site-specific DNA-methyltransferase [Chloracidobacterium sp.]|uniref:DNA-methyltransferase n=1 Tax=Chloracidobacterium validum TaxID=2821543 RepID=UPI001FEA3924|nr:site-specific DNA-methyltransferase [Chloracidobacterium validum]
MATPSEAFLGTGASYPLDAVLCGDSRQLLQGLPTKSVDLVLTSPPYFRQRDYGGGIGNEASLDAYLESLLTIFGECLRILKPTGSLVFNVGDKYLRQSLMLIPYRFATAALERFPVRLVNAVTWVKRNPTPRHFRRRLVSSTEPFFHFVVSDDYQYFPENFLRRAASPTPSRQRARIGQRYFRLVEASPLTPEEKANARAALEGCIAEVQRGEIQDFRMKIRGVHSAPFGGREGGRNIHLERDGFTMIRMHGERLKRDVIEMPVESLKGCPHRAVFPEAIVAEFIELLTRPGDVVLDPFLGAGTTAVVAKKHDRRYLGFEINPEYCAYARHRVASVACQTSFLDTVTP